jgi:anti-sigma B factor antagonist
VGDLVQVAVHGDASGVLITVAGELDLASTPELAAALHDAVMQGVPIVGLDLRAVTFFGSDAVRAVLGANADARRRGVPLVVHHPSRIVRKVLELCGALDVLTIESEEPSD